MDWPTPNAAPAPEPPQNDEKDEELDAIKKAVEDAATVSGALWFSYLFALFYFGVAAGAVTHEDLFFERAVKLPFLGIDLPLLAFFFLAPILFVIVHAYTLVHLVFLTEKAKHFDEAARAQSGDDDRLRERLPSNIFIQFLAGPSSLRGGLFGWLLKAIGWITLVIAPVSLLLMMQVQFLPFHSLSIAWTQRIALAVDLALIWWLWGRILSGREVDERDSMGSLATIEICVILTFLALMFSLTVATFPGEWQEDLLVKWDRPKWTTTPHNRLFSGPVDETTRRRTSPFSSTLVLPGLNIYEGLGLTEPEKAKWHDFFFRARGRNLRGAVFDHAFLPKVDFSGAELQGASLSYAELEGALLYRATLQNADLHSAQLQGLYLDSAQLKGAILRSAQLQGASLDSANLHGAALDGADLQGAFLANACGEGTEFDKASLGGAKLNATHSVFGRLPFSVIAYLLKPSAQNNPKSNAVLDDPECLAGDFYSLSTSPRDLYKSLRALVCSGDNHAIDILHTISGVFPTGDFNTRYDRQLKATGPYAPELITFIMSPDCPVHDKLTDDFQAKTRLLQIKSAAIEAFKAYSP